MTRTTTRISVAGVEQTIRLVRGERVMLDADLAKLYGFTTKRLNEQAKRNHERFPADFRFQLTSDEVKEMPGSRSQIATLKRGQNIKYLPFVYTEHGAIMAANVLNSRTAVQCSVEVVRAFIRLRRLLDSNAALAHRLSELERKYDAQFKVVFDAIRQLMAPPRPKRKQIGFASAMKK